MPLYLFRCKSCHKEEERLLKIAELDSVTSNCCTSECCQVIRPVGLSIPYELQGAPNPGKYWGSKPLVDINLQNDDGSTTVIPAEKGKSNW